MKWNQTKAGKIFNSDNFIVSYTEQANIQSKEDRLIKVLADEAYEKDCQWVDYGLEETQVKLDVADMVLEILVEEIIEI